MAGEVDRGSAVRRYTTYEMFGIECGKGWVGLYQPLIDLCEMKGVEILQIKEKFGGLRFYCNSYKVTPTLQLLVDAAENYSYRVCEECGKHGAIGWKDGQPVLEVTTGPSETSSWVRSLCSPCRVAWDESRRAPNGGEER